jgi:hypothetical protein
VLGDRERAFVGISAALDPLGRQAGGFHRLVDGLAAAVHENRLHADVIHEDDVGEDVGEGDLIVHDGPADFDDHHLVVESLDVGKGLNEAGGFIDGLVHHNWGNSGKLKGESLSGLVGV